MTELNVTINGKVCPAAPGETILTVAKRNGIEIPTLCQHPLVKVYGACGVCLVEIEGSPKLARACATEVRDGMNVNVRGARAEAGRRLALELLFSDHRGDCRPPCALACPAGTDCQGYVGLIANGEYKRAVSLIKEVLPLPASIGRVCPHPCETACRRQLVEEPVSIAALKRFVADMDLHEDPYEDIREAETGKKVAVIGGGPSGLTAAYFLAKHGHAPTVFEAMPKAGGMLRYGIPQYRLPKDILDSEISLIEKMGVELRCGVKIGRDVDFEALRREYDAVYVAIGAWKSSPIRCKGESSRGVLGGIDFLRDAAECQNTGMGQRVAVIGGGNTAMDACRTAIRLGAEKVYIIYRRTEAEMPAEEIEIAEAKEEGVDFRFLVSPVEIVPGEDGRVSRLRLQCMQLGEPDSTGRRSPVPVDGAFEELDVDTVIAAAGQRVAPDGIPAALTEKGTIASDEFTFLTDIPGVFAGGDAVNKGPGIAISAIGHGKKAADVIDSYLKGDIIPYCAPYVVTRDDMTAGDFSDRPKQCRERAENLTPEARRHNFREVSLGLTEEQARREASRCLECGCADYFECRLIKYGREANVQPDRLGGEKRRREERDDHPFLERNADKCVLCSLCVRVCEEVVGAGVLGLVGRGFDTIIRPDFGTPLSQTQCISCGMCAALCPTGALTEKWQNAKRLPILERETETVCSSCSLGCETVAATTGETVSRSLPGSNGLLCSGGRFGFAEHGKNRLHTARYVGRECSPEKAARAAAAALKVVSERYGADSIGVCISDRLTSEEISAAVGYARNTLGTQTIGCLGRGPSALRAVFGSSRPTATLGDIDDADLIIYVGADLMKCHGVLGMKLRKSGARLIALTGSDTLLSDRIDLTLKAKALPGIAAAVFARSDSSVPGSDELKSAVRFDGCEFASDVAGEYLAAKKPVIIYDEGSISYDAAVMLCDMALVSGKRLVLPLLPHCNSLGLALAGVSDRDALLSAKSSLRAIVSIGEDASELLTDRLEFVLTLDAHESPTVLASDAALPIADWLESEGSCVSTDGAVHLVHRAVTPKCKMDCVDALRLLNSGDVTGSFSEEASEPHALVYDSDAEILTGNV